MEASRRYLVSYLDSLVGLKIDLSSDPSKGKSLVTYDRPLKNPHVRIVESTPVKWCPPMEGWVKLNTDGSFAVNGTAGAGMVLRDDKGNVIYSACRELFSCREILEAELCACMEGLSFAIQRSDLPIIIEMDSIIAVKLIQAMDIDRSIYSSLVKEIRHLMSLRDSCITHVNRSQNKVSESDLSSNHPYHIRIESLSKSINAPALNGQQYSTHWYYERARGAYAQETHKASISTKKTFEAQNPKKQKFDKTELAKLVNIFDGRPNIASAGGQKAFLYFMQDIAKQWDKNSDSFNEYYFKRIICYKILFRETDNIVKTAEWFNSYKANIVAYSLSKLVDTIKKRYKDKSINFKAIWQNQNISLALRKQLEKLTKFTHDFLIDDSREVQNVTEWAKRPNCWLRFESIQFPLDVEFVGELVSNSEIIEEKVSAKKLQKELNLDRAMIELYKIKSAVWINLQKWNVVHKVLSPTESDLIRVATKINANYFPTEKQCVRILQVLERARDEGFPE